MKSSAEVNNSGECQRSSVLLHLLPGKKRAIEAKLRTLQRLHCASDVLVADVRDDWEQNGRVVDVGRIGENGAREGDDLRRETVRLRLSFSLAVHVELLLQLRVAFEEKGVEGLHDVGAALLQRWDGGFDDLFRLGGQLRCRDGRGWDGGRHRDGSFCACGGGRDRAMHDRRAADEGGARAMRGLQGGWQCPVQLPGGLRFVEHQEVIDRCAKVDVREKDEQKEHAMMVP